jgi:hypothetical protein
MTAADGSCSETTGIAIVLDPSFADFSDEQKSQLIAKLDAAAPEAGIGSWLFRSWKFNDGEEKLSLKIYSRPRPGG